MLSSNHRCAPSLLYVATRMGVLFISISLVGCGNASSPPVGANSTISWEEFQKMDEEQQRDPYVLDNLDESAKKKLAERNKKRR